MGDSVFSTNNNVLLRCHKQLPAINCIQHKAEKKIVKESDIVKSNIKGFGNNVGSITNRATAMISVQARFPKDSKEYKELEYRILCTQKYQQDSIDSLKGIVCTPMPKYWYDRKSCGDNEYQRSICCEKKPYFMIYRYDTEKKKYNAFIKNNNTKSQQLFNLSLDELLTKQDKTTEEKQFVEWFNKLMPVDISNCTINRICYYIEDKIINYKADLKARQIDYTIFRTNHRCTNQHKKELEELMNVYINRLSSCLNLQEFNGTVNFVEEYFQDRAREICPNDDERIDIVLDMCYNNKKSNTSKEFCWIILADLLTARKKNEEKTNI